MYAVIQIPGASGFRYYGPATKAACQQWLEDQRPALEDLYGGNFASVWRTTRVVSNKEAQSWKWLDGSKVVR